MQSGYGTRRRPSPAPRRGRAEEERQPPAVEPIEIRTEDGWALRADVHEPRGRAIGIAVLAHAMMGRRSEFDRPEGRGLARFLVARGWRTVTFDFRGHGESGPGAANGGRWTYDDLVQRDLPTVVDCVRARAGRLPVVVLGHSLGGHAALAGAGAGLLGADAFVTFGANVWMPRHEPSIAWWAAKRALLRGVDRACARYGYFPARMLRLGSDDEAGGYFAAILRFARTDAWTSDDGRFDYLAGLARVKAPVLSIVSEGDRLQCRPPCGARLLEACGGPTTLDRLQRGDDGGPAPGHMALVTSERASSAWARAEAWMRRHTKGTVARPKQSPKAPQPQNS
jgi:predicted alpha/beta hydrolase